MRRCKQLPHLNHLVCTLDKRAFYSIYDEPAVILLYSKTSFLVASELPLRSFRFFLPGTLQRIEIPAKGGQKQPGEFISRQINERDHQDRTGILQSFLRPDC